MSASRRLSRKEKTSILRNAELTKAGGLERESIILLKSRLVKQLQEIDDQVRRKSPDGEGMTAAKYARGQLIQELDRIALLKVHPSFFKSRDEIIRSLKAAAATTKHELLKRALIARAFVLAGAVTARP